MAKDNMKHRRLQELGESDFEIVDGQPDIRGWDVKTGDKTIGEVDELILDARERKVRYMIVDLDDDALDLDDDRKVLIPIGVAQLHEKDDDVIIPGITIEQLRQLPEYDRDQLTDETEYAVSSALGRTGYNTGSELDNSFYQHDHFNESSLYQRRLPASTTANNTSYLQSRQGISGSETEGYTGSDTNRLYNSDRNSVEEEIEDDVLSPVSNQRDNLNDRLNEEREDDSVDDPDFERRNRRDENGNLRSSL